MEALDCAGCTADSWREHSVHGRVQAKQLLCADVIADEQDTIVRMISAGDEAATALATEEHLTRARDKLLGRRLLLPRRARASSAR
jgi:hypothetical protein